jgi:dipeptidyl aminopeptidase/acylaminoacyl peptidase
VLQRVSFRGGSGSEIEGILHLPDGETLGGAPVLGGRAGSIEGGAYLCEALASAGIAALRFAFREEDALARLADTAGAIRLLRAHPTIPQRIGVVGHSYGAAIAALAAGRDSRVRAAVLLAPPAERDYFGAVKPIAEVSRTRAKVLIVKAAADTVVDPADADRYAAVLRQAGAVHRVVTIDGADHEFTSSAQRAAMLDAVTAWLRESLAG